MKRSKAILHVTGCLLALLCLAVPNTGAADREVFAEKKAFETEFAVSAGLRTDNLSWSIAADSTGTLTPNILSELNFDDLRSYLLSIKNTTTIANRIYFRGEIATGNIYSGETQDSDYLGDNRSLEFSRSIGDNDGDSVFDFSLAGGYRFNFAQNRFAIIPLVGYSYHEQNIAISNGVQVIPNTGSFEGLNSTYEVEWSGPWVGVDIFHQNKPSPDSNWVLIPKVGFEMHWADYKGVGNWNLRSDLRNPDSFVQEADALGLVFRAGLDFQWKEYWTFSLGYQYSNWETDAGLDTVYFNDGSYATTRFNEADWTSHVMSVGVGIRF